MFCHTLYNTQSPLRKAVDLGHQYSNEFSLDTNFLKIFSKNVKINETFKAVDNQSPMTSLSRKVLTLNFVVTIRLIEQLSWLYHLVSTACHVHCAHINMKIMQGMMSMAYVEMKEESCSTSKLTHSGVLLSQV